MSKLHRSAFLLAHTVLAGMFASITAFSQATTSTHQASHISTKALAYAEIEIGVRHLMQEKIG